MAPGLPGSASSTAVTSVIPAPPSAPAACRPGLADATPSVADAASTTPCTTAGSVLRTTIRPGRRAPRERLGERLQAVHRLRLDPELLGLAQPDRAPPESPRQP